MGSRTTSFGVWRTGTGTRATGFLEISPYENPLAVVTVLGEISFDLPRRSCFSRGCPLSWCQCMPGKSLWRGKSGDSFFPSFLFPRSSLPPSVPSLVVFVPSLNLEHLECLAYNPLSLLLEPHALSFPAKERSGSTWPKSQHTPAGLSTIQPLTPCPSPKPRAPCGQDPQIGQASE